MIGENSVEKKSLGHKVLLIFLILLIINAVQGYLLGLLRQQLLEKDAIGLFRPAILLLQMGIILPILLKATNIKVNELGLNLNNIKKGFVLAIKYFLWIIILGYIMAFIQAYPSYSSFEPRQWRVLRFIDEGWYQFSSILITPVIWEEIISRGFFFAYLTKLGFHKQYNLKRIKVDKTILITAIFFSLTHLGNFIGVTALPQIIYAIIYILGAIIVGYMLGLIRKKTDSLFWPIILHTVANFGEWVVKIMIPIALVNNIPK